MPTPTATPPSRRKPSRQPSIWIPPGSASAEGDESNKLRLTLEQSWKNAIQEFKKKTGGKELGDYRGGKDGVLGVLRSRFAEDNKAAQKQSNLLSIVEKTLNAIELVGGVAIQVASMVFAPANLCFNALVVLFKIPREIKKFTEDLHALFNEVTSFLNNFKIFRRLDSRSLLDQALVTSTNDILIKFVEVIALSINALEHPAKIVLGNLFLRDDAISGAIKSFKDLVDKQSTLTTTVTLETVLENKELTSEILQSTSRLEETSQETNTIIKSLQASNVDNKTVQVNRDRLKEIEQALGVSETVAMAPINDLEALRPQLLDNTLIVFSQDDSYKDWLDTKLRRTILFVTGDSDSGKTHILCSLQQKIVDDQRKLRKGDPSIYYAYYAFSRVDECGHKPANKFDSPLHTALRIMAVQLARQSTTYAKVLYNVRDKIKSRDTTLREFFKALQIDSFSAPPGSLLYMLFDGIDRLKSNFDDATELLNQTIPKNTLKEDPNRPSFRLIFTGRTEIIHQLPSGTLAVLTSDFNNSLIKNFVEVELKRQHIFQDKDVETLKRKEQLINEIPNYAKGSFGVASQKLQVVKDFIDSDADPDDLIEELLNGEQGTKSSAEGKQILDEVCAELNEQHISQLRETLKWAIYARIPPHIDILEAALFLQRGKHSLEPLKKKLITRFDRIFRISDNSVVWADSRIEDYFEYSARSGISADKTKTSSINMQLIINNADRETVKKFFWDLHQNFDQFDFVSSPAQPDYASQVYFTELDAHVTIVTRCLKALNDDKLLPEAEPVTYYAAKYLPTFVRTLFACFQKTDFSRHMTFIEPNISSLDTAQRKSIGQGLVNFFSDVLCSENAQEFGPFDVRIWFSKRNLKAIQDYLRSPDLLAILEPIERRWAEQHYKPVKFLRPVAEAVAYKWLNDTQTNTKALDCFNFIHEYIKLCDRQRGSRRKHFRSTSSSRSGSRTSVPDRSSSHSNSPVQIQETASPVAVEGERNANKLSSNGIVDVVSIEKDGLTSSTNTIVPENGVSDTRFERRQDSRDRNVNLNHNSSDKIPPGSNVSVQMPSDGTKAELEKVSTGLTTDTSVTQSPQHEDHDQREILQNDAGITLNSVNDGISKPGEDSASLDQANDHAEGCDNENSDDETESSSDTDASISSGSITPERSRSSSVVGDTINMVAEDDSSFLERVERALEWVKQEFKFEFSLFSWVRIGQTLLGIDNEAAAKYFRKPTGSAAAEDPWHIYYLAKALVDQEKYQEAIDVMEPLIKVFRAGIAKIDTGKSKRNKKSWTIGLSDTLERMAQCYMAQKSEQISIEYMEEALKSSPENDELRWRLFTTLCRQPTTHSQAQQMWENWRLNHSLAGGSSLTTLLLAKMQDEPNGSILGAIFIDIKNTPILESMIEVLREGIREADEQEHIGDKCLLYFANGLAYAVHRRPNDAQRAIEVWEKCIDTYRTTGWSDDTAFLFASDLAACHHFDKARAAFSVDLDMSVEQRAILCEQLSESIRNVLTPVHRKWRQVDRPSSFLASFYALSGQPDMAKSMFKDDMAQAIDILSDDDPDNDNIGIFLLVKIFNQIDRRVDSLTAYSLLDHEYLRVKKTAKALSTLESSASEEANNSDSGSTAQNQEEQPSQHDHEDSGANDNPTAKADADRPTKSHSKKTKKQAEELLKAHRTSTDLKSPPDALYSDNQGNTQCSACSAQLESRSETGFWMCKFCPGIRLCISCKDKLCDGTLRVYLCNPEHKFAFMRHYDDYADEDIWEDKETMNVRIDWSLEENEDGTVPKRSGGRIVTLKAWLEMLREEWNVPLPIEGSERRAQK